MIAKTEPQSNSAIALGIGLVSLPAVALAFAHMAGSPKPAEAKPLSADICSAILYADLAQTASTVQPAASPLLNTSEPPIITAADNYMNCMVGATRAAGLAPAR